jgi:hypothetical protein
MRRNERIRTAIRDLLHEGVRPSVRKVRDHLIATGSVGHSHREIMPIVREWRASASGDQRIAEIARRYRALDPERRAHVRDRLDNIDKRSATNA